MGAVLRTRAGPGPYQRRSRQPHRGARWSGAVCSYARRVDHGRGRSWILDAVEHEIGNRRGSPAGRRRGTGHRVRRRGWRNSATRAPPRGRAPGGVHAPGRGPRSDAHASGKRSRGLGSSSVTPRGAVPRAPLADAPRCPPVQPKATSSENNITAAACHRAVPSAHKDDRPRDATAVASEGRTVSEGNTTTPPRSISSRTRRRSRRRRPTTTRSIPARSRTVSTSRNPHRAPAPRTPGQPAPTSSATSRAAVAPTAGRQHGDGSSPNRSGRRAAPAPLVSTISASAPRRPLTYGGFETTASILPVTPASRSPWRNEIVSPSRAAFARAHSERFGARIGGNGRRGRDARVASASAESRPSRADVAARAPWGQVEQRLDQVLVSGRGITRAGRLRARSSESPYGRGCRRPARARAGAPRSPGRRALLAPDPCRVRDDHRAIDLHRSGQQYFGIQPRRLAAGRR